MTAAHPVTYDQHPDGMYVVVPHAETIVRITDTGIILEFYPATNQTEPTACIELTYEQWQTLAARLKG